MFMVHECRNRREAGAFFAPRLKGYKIYAQCAGNVTTRILAAAKTCIA
jgi:hypothetical protein